MLKNGMKPAIHLMNRLQYKYKLGLVGLVLFIPIMALALISMHRAAGDVIRSMREQGSLQILEQLDMFHDTYMQFVDQKMTINFKQSNTQAHKELDQVIQKLKDQATELSQIRIPGDKKNIWPELVNSFVTSFDELNSVALTAMANPQEIYDRYHPLSLKIVSLYNSMSNLSGLINDHELKAFYLGKIITEYIPKMRILKSKARAYGVFAIAQVNPTSMTYDALDALVDEMLNQEPLMRLEIDYGLSQTEDSGTRLKAAADTGLQSLVKISDYMLEQLIEAIEIEVNEQAFAKTIDSLSTPIQDFNRDTRQELNQILTRRIFDQKLSQAITLFFLLIVIGLAIYLSMALMITVKMTISNLSGVAQSMAEGDFTVQSDIPIKDEMLVLRDAFNSMGLKVKTLLLEVQNTADLVANQAQEVEKISEQGSRVVSEQLNKTQLVVGSVAELGDSVNKVCQNTSSVADAANDALQLAEDGNTQVVKTVRQNTSAMKEAAHSALRLSKDGSSQVHTAIESIEALKNEINGSMELTNKLSEKSIQIFNIVDVIKRIASQTNLLSLNAAIEAASAGEQGRGFAVVAEEVRNLAKKTEEATDEIEASIQDLQTGVSEAVKTMLASNTKVEDTVQESLKVREALNRITSAVEAITQRNADNELATDKVREALDRITTAVEAITQKNSENEEATSDQEAVAKDIEANVNMIIHSAQESAEGSGQTATASRQMAELAETLRKLISSFKV